MTSGISATMNVTSFSNDAEGPGVLWGICLALNLLVTTGTIWVVIAFIICAKSSNILSKKSRSDMDGGLIFKTALASVILPLSKYGTSIAIMVVGLDPRSDAVCEILIYANNISLAASVISLYIFLWLRQRAFYSHPSLGSIFNKAIAALSRISLAILIPTIVSSVIIDMVTNNYTGSEGGCVFENDQTESNVRFYIYGAVLIIGQGTLIGLFVSEPMTKGTQKPDPSVKDGGEERRRKKRKGSTIVELIRRTQRLASVSMLSDILAMGISGVLAQKNYPYYVVCVLLDVDLAVNTITIVGSFKSWTDIMFGGIIHHFRN